MLKQKQQRKRNKQKETTTARETSCWIIRHEITNWFLGRLFDFSLFCLFVVVVVFFPPVFSLFLFLSPFLSFLFSFFLAEYWGGQSRLCHPACYAPVLTWFSLIWSQFQFLVIIDFFLGKNIYNLSWSMHWPNWNKSFKAKLIWHLQHMHD